MSMAGPNVLGHIWLLRSLALKVVWPKNAQFCNGPDDDRRETVLQETRFHDESSEIVRKGLG